MLTRTSTIPWDGKKLIGYITRVMALLFIFNSFGVAWSADVAYSPSSSKVPLEFSDLLYIDLSGLTYGQGSSCGDAGYVAFRFFCLGKSCYYGERKGLNKNGCSYVDGSEGDRSIRECQEFRVLGHM